MTPLCHGRVPAAALPTGITLPCIPSKCARSGLRVCWECRSQVVLRQLKILTWLPLLLPLLRCHCSWLRSAAYRTAPVCSPSTGTSALPITSATTALCLPGAADIPLSADDIVECIACSTRCTTAKLAPGTTPRECLIPYAVMVHYASEHALCWFAKEHANTHIYAAALLACHL